VNAGCCNLKLYGTDTHKCVKTHLGPQIKPMNYLDYIKKKLTPDWLKCSQSRISSKTGQPVSISCLTPNMDWADIYDDYEIIS
jgi:hypothetical protein